MKLLTTTDCAIRMLLCLAAEKRLVVSGELARKIGVDQRYLLKVGRVLKDAGFVHATLGPFGGYCLIKPPESVSIFDIAALFDDSVKCSGLHDLTDTAVLAADRFYREMERHAENFFRSYTLADLLETNETIKK